LVLKLYRWPSDDWRKLGADLPPEIIWIDLLSPSDEEKQFVERRLNIRVPSEESLGEIEASSRLIFEHDTLYLSSPSVRLDEDEPELTSIGFIIGPRVLVTVHFWPLPTFDKVAKQMETDADLQNGMCVFTGLVEAMVDRGADVLEQLGTNADHLSRSVFKGALVRSKRPVRSSRRMREALASVGDLADRLAKARDVLLNVGRIAAFAGEVGSDWITPASKRRLEAVSKDVVSLSDYESRLSDKIQLLLDAILGFISIQQNDLFKILTIVSVVGIPPTVVAGVYGMNFKFMPELNWEFGYPYGLAMIALSAIIPLVWFKWRGWF
jgi:magnesium transporter